MHLRFRQLIQSKRIITADDNASEIPSAYSVQANNYCR